MEQLLKITSVPMRYEIYRQDAHLVSSDMLETEYRKAVAKRMSAFREGSVQERFRDISAIGQLYKAVGRPAEALEGTGESQPVILPITQGIAFGEAETPEVKMELSQLEYGKFAGRVQRGDLEVIPGFSSMVVIQYPKVCFEYLGKPLYVPPSAGEALDMYA